MGESKLEHAILRQGVLVGEASNHDTRRVHALRDVAEKARVCGRAHFGHIQPRSYFILFEELGERARVKPAQTRWCRFCALYQYHELFKCYKPNFNRDLIYTFLTAS